MATTIQSTALDFNNIKNNLKTYLEKQSEFSDYDFEASGLSNILDVLAYNTHINALVANMTLNESFLGTAQLRSSVASIATGLGYIPFSKTAAKGVIRCSLDLSSVTNRPSTISLPRYTKFTALVDDETYVFQTLEEYIGTDDGTGVYQFLNSNASSNLEIFEGTVTTKTFLVGETFNTDVYIIPDVNMDTNTANVEVYPTSTSNVATTYGNITDATSITSESSVYILKETPNGFFQLSFGTNNSLGNEPTAGNRIVLTYLSTNGDLANRATSFTPSEQLSINGTSYNLFATTISRSAGGKDKESVESIRRSAPFQYATQNRMVTAEDYASLIKRTYPTSITSINAWGGEENPEPKFGTVFASINYSEDTTSTQITSIQRGIRELVQDLAIISFNIEFVDTLNTYIENSIFYQLNPNLTPLSVQALNAQIKSVVSQYYADNTGDFDLSFRRSNLLTLIDAISPAILSSRAEVKMQQRITPTINAVNTFTLNFPSSIKEPFGTEEQILTSSFFNIKTVAGNERLVKMKNLGNKIQIYDTNTGAVLVDNIGSIDYISGIVSIVSFKPSEIPGGTEIKVSVTPANQSAVSPTRNNILQYDAENSLVSPVIVTASN